jgi:phosphoglycolate phosphatase
MANILFDLDGTLIDSAPSILEAFETVLVVHGLSPKVPLDRSLIGPPLRTTLSRLSGVEDPAQLEEFAQTFRAWYDTQGVANTIGYPGLKSTLSVLRVCGHSLMVITNKRLFPAQAILGRLGVAELFEAIYGIDAFDPPLVDKGQRVAMACRNHGIARHDAFLIGDSLDDAQAAAHNSVLFIAATYGYGAPPLNEPHAVACLESLEALPQLLQTL